MPAHRKPPSYLKKVVNGTVYARTIVDGKFVALGLYGSTESYEAHERIVTQWRAREAERQGQTVAGPTGDVRTVGELIARFVGQAKKKWTLPDGRTQEEWGNYRLVLRVLRRLYEDLPVRDFGPRALKELRRAMISGAWMNPLDRVKAEARGRGKGWSRKVVNRMVNRVLYVWRWAESEQLVPASSTHALETVSVLAVGEDGARELPDVPPVPEGDLEKSLPFLDPIPRAIVDVLLLTGARPSEVLRLRPSDINQTGTVEVAKGIRLKLGAKVWVVQPEKHKTAWKGHKKVILIGPRCQEILAPYLAGRDPESFLFSPSEAREAQLAKMRAARKTKVQPSQRYRRKRNPKRKPGTCWKTPALQHTITRACKKAGVGHWTAYQLRHNAATRIVQEWGWEIAQAVLGHRALEMTRKYGLPDIERAAKAMEKAG